MQFPHLNDTKFPNLNNVNVYQFQNNFDYSRWNEKTKITLCNVLWNSDYTDVVKWDSDTLRDAWFDSLDDYWTTELQSSARIVPDGFVKLPIPYDVLARYNYLFVDLPIATSADQMIDYEKSIGIRRWYFFINNIEYLSPSATQAYVIPDVWTNFQNDIDITYMLLERGHAPVAASDVEEYLANPIENNRYLLAPDVNFDNASITRGSTFVPFGNGTKYVCLATTCSPDLVSTLGTVTTDSNYNPESQITYSDVDARYGYQLQVNGLGVGNGRNYSNARTATKPGFSDGRIANNLTVYALAATECYDNGTFFADVIAQCPQFLNTVKACFVVDDACITRGTAYTIAGHTLYKCVGKSSTLLTKSLTVSDFDYPTELQRFAKLYTSPYAKLEITDNDGTTCEVNIEETTTLNVKSVTSIAFPYINERVYIEGIGGVGSSSYSWVDLNGNTNARNISNSDWFKYCFDWEIPTFALYMDGQTAFMLESFNRNVKQARLQDLVSYHNTMRSANTAYENACDQADVAYDNVVVNASTALTNARASADTAKTNADNIANTTKTNTDSLADTEKTNADNSADTAKTNAYNDAIQAYRVVDRNCYKASQNLATANAALDSNRDFNVAEALSIAYLNNHYEELKREYSNYIINATTDAEIQKATACTNASAIGGVLTSAINGAMTGAMQGGPEGAVVMGASAGVGAGISAAVSIHNNMVITDTSRTIADNTMAYNSYMQGKSNDLTLDLTGISNSILDWTTDNHITSTTTQMQNSNTKDRDNGQEIRDTAKTNADNVETTAKTNSANTQTTIKTNATNSQTTAKTNATNTQTTSKENARRTYNATVDNALRTKTNVQANAGYTREVAELNAKEILENGKNTAMAGIEDAKNRRPIELCTYSGNPQADYMQTRGIQIKVKTQSISAIRQTGDIFARFGYNLNQVWNVAQSGLKLMRHFTYWKAAEIWVDDRKTSNNAVNNFIHNMFINGVTVWNNPSEIGKVNVYNN